MLCHLVISVANQHVWAWQWFHAMGLVDMVAILELDIVTLPEINGIQNRGRIAQQHVQTAALLIVMQILFPDATEVVLSCVSRHVLDHVFDRVLLPDHPHADQVTVASNVQRKLDLAVVIVLGRVLDSVWVHVMVLEQI